MAYSPMTIPTGQQQMARSQSVQAQNTAAPQTPTPVSPSMPSVSLPGSQSQSGTSQSQLALGRPQGQNTGVPLSNAAQVAPQSMAGLVNLPPQMQMPNVQAMAQNISRARMSQDPIMMQTILGMLGPGGQRMPAPSIGQIMQPAVGPTGVPTPTPTAATAATTNPTEIPIRR